MKSITILDPNAPPEERKAVETPIPSDESILDRPVHDTGSLWYKILCFFLPIIGIFVGLIFRKHNYIRNYKSCMKGAWIGLGTRAVIILIFCLLLILAVI